MQRDTEVKSKDSLSAIANGLIQGPNKTSGRLSLAPQFQIKLLLKRVELEYIVISRSLYLLGQTNNNSEDASLCVASHYVLVSEGRSSFQLSIKKVMKADLFVR